MGAGETPRQVEFTQTTYEDYLDLTLRKAFVTPPYPTQSLAYSFIHYHYQLLRYDVFPGYEHIQTSVRRSQQLQLVRWQKDIPVFKYQMKMKACLTKIL